MVHKVTVHLLFAHLHLEHKQLKVDSVRCLTRQDGKAGIAFLQDIFFPNDHYVDDKG